MAVETGEGVLRRNFFHSPKKILPFDVKYKALNSVFRSLIFFPLIYGSVIYWTYPSFQLEEKVTVKWQK